MVKNDKGVTLIELLISIVLLSIILVPLLMIMTGSLTRTTTQERETGNAYVAQKVMEKVRSNQLAYKLGANHYCTSEIEDACNGLEPLPFSDELDLNQHQIVEVIVSDYEENLAFHEVFVTVRNDDKISYGDGLVDTENVITLVTVVKK